ncbi:capsular exopolysaccharide synthesis family protein [Sphingomonas endophytica]|uniref:Capsular exopolysaccharide synthesis family protein n=1 Tax=Sphingomonas endophytica TaxID=869719 RepID=A0A7X0MN23_9SPHN|nr:polysaccharide biosynthesis tyrosine autokinase [Sphingomonas endophytica]MBB6505247.1 capsular exopolysaccharide synthesis family protein [Sphingomonas endophytica]
MRKIIDATDTADYQSMEAGGVPRLPLLRQYLRIALRWRYVVGGIIAGCLLLGIIITFVMTRQYTAATTVEISRESNNIVAIQGVEREAGLADQEFYQTQYGLLRSRSLAERVAGQLRLVDDPTFFKQFKVKSDAPAFDLINGRYSPTGRQVRQRVAGDVLLDHVDIAPTRLSRLVEIRVTTPSPELSAKIANAWTASFIQASLERRYQATSYARNFLENRLEQLRSRLEISERQLVSYASAQRIINLPAAQEQGRTSTDRSILTDDLTALNTALTAATADRIAAQAHYEQRGAAGATTEALRNVAINNLRQRRAELAAEYKKLMMQFQPEYPTAKAVAAQMSQIDQSIAREESRVTGSLQAEYRQALDREQRLKSRVEALKQGFLDLRRRSIQYNIFQREVDTNRQLYDGLLQRYKEIGVAGGVGVNNVAIVDPAEVPNRPSSPRLVLNLALALILGCGLGVLAALALEQIDEAIVDPADIQKELGVPLLGSVPKLREGQPKDALLDRKSELVDAYLAVQTNLQFTSDAGIPRSIAVTSTRPAEGKSTTALALATTLARAHKRVILIDGDMRSPSVHHLIGTSHDRGLSNFLSGQNDIDALLVGAEALGFVVMTAGPIPPNAAELLTGDRLKVLIDRLLEQFDHVVIDSPPVMGLADASLIGSHVQGVVYAVESHGTRTSSVKIALSRLASSRARILGMVVTKFESKKASYGYGYDYGYGYGRAEQDA